jgi:hypothetical protein
MSGELKINMKLGEGVEFNAEGPEALVREALASFLEQAAQRVIDQSSRANGPPSEDESATSKLSNSLLERVFRLDGGVVSLRVMPTTAKADADAIMLLLYAYNRMKNQYDVATTQLGQAAKQTGIRADRLDRIVAQNREYIIKSGFKKGVRYGLNNLGIKRSEELIPALLG